jgi:transcriptional regulator with XRE-family HTH domain
MDISRGYIGRRVREARIKRGWTQAELAARLDLSQGRLSQVERGDGSFTAEQFLEILKIFNLSISDFVVARDERAALQNELVRLGAGHLRVSPSAIAERGVDAFALVVRDALLSGSPRLITALAPVLVEKIDHVSLSSLLIMARSHGLERRVGWLLDNVQDAVRSALHRTRGGLATLRYSRALIVLRPFLEEASLHGPLSLKRLGADGEARPSDVLDTDIRGDKSFEQTWRRAHPIAKAWGVVTAIRRFPRCD